MNLNFYDPSNSTYLQSLQTTLTDSLNKLEQLRNVPARPQQTSVVQPQEQRYYLDCGNKDDWQEFLKLNYNITETQIFNDYKLFLQAKEELRQDNNKEKLQAMKDKLSDKGNAQLTPQSVKAINNYQEVNSGYNTNNSNETASQINGTKFAKINNSNENKGVKHAR